MIQTRQDIEEMTGIYIKGVLAHTFNTLPDSLANIDKELSELQKTIHHILPTTPTGGQKPIHDVIKQHVERIVVEAYALGRDHGDWLENHQSTLAEGEGIKSLLENYILKARGEVAVHFEEETTTGEHEQIA
jgi:hypothetical protein